MHTHTHTHTRTHTRTHAHTHTHTLSHTYVPMQNELVSYRGSLEEHQQMVESAHAEVEDKERSELEMKVEMELMREELERLRCSEDTLQNRLDLYSQTVTVC